MANLTILDADLEAAPVVAQATSRRPKSTNWTTLTIYSARFQSMTTEEGRYAPPPGTNYIAEIVGGTTKAGEVERVRRAPFPTLAKALNWSSFDFASALYDELRRAVIDSLESGGHLPPMLIVTSGVADELQIAVQDGPGGAITAMQAVPWMMKPPVMRCGFTGKGGLLGAIQWLYEGIIPDEDDQAAVDAFARDFGIDRRDVGAAVFACGVGYSQTDLNGWKALIACLRFFDREAFHANRAAG